MNPWLAGTLILALGGLIPAGVLASRGDPVDRLVGVELGSAVVTLALMLFAQFMNQAQYLVVPLVLVVVSFAGTLAYTRLLPPMP